MNISKKSLHLHKKLRGKIALAIKKRVRNRDDLSLLYTPGVGAVASEVARDPEKSFELNSRANWVAVVSDGSAVLGLGNVGPDAALAVMEGKAILFKQFADVDAFPICLATQDTEEIIRVVKAIAPNFGGINLEDIAAPKCFEIENRLKAELDIPVMHDDQHATAVVVLAGLINACKISGREFSDLKVVISGAGAAGTGVAKILVSQGVTDIVICDSKGIVSRERGDLNAEKKSLLEFTNRYNVSGSFADAFKVRNVFIGLSVAGIVSKEMIHSMESDPIVFAMANPVPEIMPDEARLAGARIIATGRSDFPNQVNNAMAFPGIFRGALDARAKNITEEMKIAAAHALAERVKKPTPQEFMPSPIDKKTPYKIAKAVARAAKN
jgi:malate dehydrogenase (oxaloacetate-decarboxylating)